MDQSNFDSWDKAQVWKQNYCANEKIIEQRFPKVLFVMVHEEVLTFKSVGEIVGESLAIQPLKRKLRAVLS